MDYMLANKLKSNAIGCIESPHFGNGMKSSCICLGNRWESTKMR